MLQMNSQEDPEANAQFILDQIKDKSQDVDFVIAPENCLFCGQQNKIKPNCDIIFDTVLPQMSKQLPADLPVILGGVPMKSQDPKRFYNCWLSHQNGGWQNVYQKQKLFRAEVPGQRSYTESENFIPGTDCKVLNLFSKEKKLFRLGASICFDLRFGDIYNQESAMGADILTVPSAFTQLTGEAHWHVLLRARAIENQTFVVAPAQVGVAPGDRLAYGHSLVVDPWGRVLFDAEEKVGGFIIELDLDLITTARQHIVMNEKVNLTQN